MSYRSAVIHELKTWPEPFAALWNGCKRYEIRRTDRPFDVGDVLVLREFDPILSLYSGRQVRAIVTYMTRQAEWGLPADLCVMSLGATRNEVHP